ncbi:cysteine desulfurase family protein [Salsuginibacillus kocurii]|uniref:cysteine desulfurase family protein n=1 Tax=Salsuginibacillus kocurii TaxID=427078 RepID=UPI000379651B|nr:cysteine desulfurase family protein [Salsuginibacillus kocurii]
MQAIYADHAATTPVRPEVVDEVIPHMQSGFGNPSSIHQFGREARKTLDQARRVIATSIHANSEEIILTSGGTEANNLAIIGYAEANQERGKHIITTQIEHHAVLHPCEHLEARGFEVTYLSVNEEGIVSLQDLQEAVREDTILVSVMYGNNETGAMQPVEEIASYLEPLEIAFHTDAVQVYGSVSLDVTSLPVDLLTASAHKINGPKGAGFLYVGPSVRLEAALKGGEQERKRRAGTENVPAMAGFAKAVTLLMEERTEREQTYVQVADAFLKALKENEVAHEVNAERAKRLPHIVNVYFPGIPVEQLLMNLDLEGVAVSSGSACTAGSIEPSHVLYAMYGQEERIYSSVRFSFGYQNTEEEAEKIAQVLKKVTERLQAK